MKNPFSIFARKSSPSWESLSREDRVAFTRKAIRAVRVMAKAGKYKIVNSPVRVRDAGAVETTGEDRILDFYQRARLLDLARDSVRNSSTLNAIFKQFDLNAVGTCGGKATFVLEDQAKADALRTAFARWTRNADFFDGLSFNTFLKIALKTYMLGGDLVILFDDGLVEDSGRLLVYEPDEIGNIQEADVQTIYGAGAKQSLGRIYSPNGRFIGVNVSRSCRGQNIFDTAKCYTLKCDPNADFADSSWIMPRNVFRIAQGRGVSPLASPLSTIIDLEDLTEFELQAAKKNSQTIAQVIETGNPEPELPSAFEAGTDFASMTDAEINEAAASEAEVTEKVVTLEQIKGAGVLYESLPEGRKLELLDTKHPNANMPEFIRWLAGRAAAPFGLGSVYATLKADASYTAFRGEQVMSQPAFEEAQKFLEQICDWCLVRWSRWATRKGLIQDPGEDFIGAVSWQWPRMREVNQVDEQNAIAMKLRNGTGSYLEIYGANWQSKLRQIAKEVEVCKSLNLVHPQAVTSAGAIIEENQEQKGNQ